MPVSLAGVLCRPARPSRLSGSYHTCNTFMLLPPHACVGSALVLKDCSISSLIETSILTRLMQASSRSFDRKSMNLIGFTMGARYESPSFARSFNFCLFMLCVQLVSCSSYIYRLASVLLAQHRVSSIFLSLTIPTPFTKAFRPAT